MVGFPKSGHILLLHREDTAVGTFMISQSVTVSVVILTEGALLKLPNS